MLTDNQITALAREFSKEHDDSTIAYHAAKDVINFLLRRYCLVEKSKVEQMYKEAAEGNCKLEKMRPQNTYAKNSIAMRIGVNFGCVHTLKSLFPDLGKEVEG